MSRAITEQMNSDMFDNILKTTYDIKDFSKLELDQAKQSFNYNRYKVFETELGLSVKKIL